MCASVYRNIITLCVKWSHQYETSILELENSKLFSSEWKSPLIYYICITNPYSKIEIFFFVFATHSHIVYVQLACTKCLFTRWCAVCVCFILSLIVCFVAHSHLLCNVQLWLNVFVLRCCYEEYDSMKQVLWLILIYLNQILFNIVCLS